ncbi:uracil-DNA glycosylase [Ammoniphilus oxalaticus]|uniref:Uracil-DNA glycosylase n=1 Tax=Ammoniphilus oxalaticus TaxID=66863 RepID=A0A419SLA1_9BACL|nr:uracil-DNA glycosylase [Ammoniphilus oxalaticus]
MLPEETAPPDARACEKCELSTHRQRVVWGEGNPTAPLFILLDNPGLRENKEGQPFVCGTRQTLQRGLLEAGLDLDSVYITYLLKCRPKKAYDKPLARQTCFSHLQFQLMEKKPQFMLGLGNTVAQTLFSDENVDVKGLRGSWHLFQDSIPIAFSYHPLAVRRRPALYRFFLEDLQHVAARFPR